MVTGIDDSESIDRAYDAGATDFVIKPINWSLIGYRMRYILRSNRAEVAAAAGPCALERRDRILPGGIPAV